MLDYEEHYYDPYEDVSVDTEFDVWLEKNKIDTDELDNKQIDEYYYKFIEEMESYHGPIYLLNESYYY